MLVIDMQIVQTDKLHATVIFRQCRFL